MWVERMRKRLVTQGFEQALGRKLREPSQTPEGYGQRLHRSEVHKLRLPMIDAWLEKRGSYRDRGQQ